MPPHPPSLRELAEALIRKDLALSKRMLEEGEEAWAGNINYSLCQLHYAELTQDTNALSALALNACEPGGDSERRRLIGGPALSALYKLGGREGVRRIFRDSLAGEIADEIYVIGFFRSLDWDQSRENMAIHAQRIPPVFHNLDWAYIKKIGRIGQIELLSAVSAVLFLSGRLEEARSSIESVISAQRKSGRADPTLAGYFQFSKTIFELTGEEREKTYSKEKADDGISWLRKAEPLEDDLVIFGCGDAKYLKLYAEPFLSSFSESGCAAVHLHGFDVDENDRANLEALADKVTEQNSGARISISVEDTPYREVSANLSKSGYYSALRFISAHKVRQAYAHHFLMLDIDSRNIGDLEQIKQSIRKDDADIIIRKREHYILEMLFAAGFILLRNTPASDGFFDLFRTFLERCMAIGPAWFADQIALAYIHYYLPELTQARFMNCPDSWFHWERDAAPVILVEKGFSD